MKSLIDNLQKRRTQETGASLMIAVLLMVIMLGLVTSITAAIILGTQKSGQTRDYTFFSLAGDAALNDALLTANTETLSDGITSLVNYIGPENAKTGTLTPDGSPNTEINWRWYALPTPSTAPYTSYQIYASGYRGDDPEVDNAFHVTARLSSFAVAGGQVITNADGVQVYKLPSRSLFSKGAVGINNVSLQDGASILSFNSAVGTDPGSHNANTPKASFSTAGEVRFHSYGGYASHGHLYGMKDGESAEDRCIGGCLLPMKMTTFSFDAASYSDDPTTSPDGKCTTYSNYRSSVNGTSINPSGGARHLCVEDLVIDQDTIYSSRFTTGAPLTIFVNGDLVIEPGKKLRNAGWMDSARGPMALRLVVRGNVNVAGHPTTPTELSALTIATEGGSCTISEPGQRARVIGAIACDNLTVNGDGVIWHDAQTIMTEVEQGPTGVDGDDTRAWSLSEYEIISSLPEQ